RSSLFATAGLLARSSSSAQAPVAPSASAAAPRPTAGPAAPTVTEFRPLRRDVGIFTGRGGSIGWLSSKDALVAVDTQFPDTAATFATGLPGRGGRTFDVVINTHHHGDHTGGNPVLKPLTKSIVAHANVPKLQFAAAEKANTLDKQVYADATFPEVWRREIGSEVVVAQYHGTAHTSGDVIVLFEKANVVHMGDLMFNRIYPVIDRVSGGRIKHWITVLEEAAKTYPADAIYIFGHGSTKFGPTGKRDDLLVFRDYLSGLLDYTSKKIAAGEPKEKIMGLENLPGFADFHLPLPNRLSGNLGTAYDELTDKKS
ncbi:MAG: MBL fold metallo-hydrolase, partial [Verrucomicrobia bacterium]|nr:MBL fold metallo-hydrolase [Verrucomicrobiota bacterium]